MSSKVSDHINKHIQIYSIIAGVVCGTAAHYLITSKKFSDLFKKKSDQTGNTNQESIDSPEQIQEIKNLIQQKRQISVPMEVENYQQYPTPGSNIYKICITGGPCAGKTSGMSYLTEKLTEMGFQVYVVPEAATLIAQGGGMINLANYTNEQSIQFQTQLMRVQIQLEQCFQRLAKLNISEDKPTVVLCDRGAMDGSAYMSNEQWEEMLRQDYFKKNQLNVSFLRDKNYDAVIHLVTAADGAIQHYDKNNEVRHESAIDAIKLDRLLQQAYLGHPIHEIIPNVFPTFGDKLKKLLETVLHICGVKQNFKTHKKYLIDPSMLQPQIPPDVNCQQYFIEDTFITYEKNDEQEKGQYIKVRKRNQKDSSIYIWSRSQMEKGKDKISLKKMMTYKEYLTTLSRIDEKRHPIIKHRQLFMWEGCQYTVDTFLNVNEGFSTLKVKQTNDNDVQIPPFIKVIREITTDDGYKSKYLSKKDWYVPSGDEKIINFRKDSFDNY